MSAFNLEQANKIMDENQIDALIASDTNTLKYFGYSPWISLFKQYNFMPGGLDYPGLTSFCIIPYKKNPSYILLSQGLGFLEGNDYKNVFPYGPYTEIGTEEIEFENDIDLDIYKLHQKGISDSPVSALKEALKSLNLEKGRIAIEEIGITPDTLSQIKEDNKGVDFFDGTELLRLTRMIKTAGEIELLGQSIAITEKAMLSSINFINPGKLFGGARKEFKKVIFNEEADLNHYIIFSRGLGFKENDDYVIENNSVIGIDLGCDYKNYICDTAATIFIGKVDPINNELYKKILDVLETGLNMLKPGIKCSRVYDEMIKIKDSHGLEQCMPEGHGIGINHHEYPKIGSSFNYEYNDGFKERSADYTLEADMVLNIEVPAHYHGKKGLSIEKTVRVTESGFVELAAQNRKVPFIR